MKIDVGLRGADLGALGARRPPTSASGSMVCGRRDRARPVPAAARRGARDRAGEPGHAIAVAFARTPFAVAQTAWDLQRASGGRLRLGLGTQVRAHVERRFSAAFEHPAARIVDYIRCVRAIWDTFQTGARPAYEGRFYRFTLISDFFNPGPIAHPDIPISLAGVGERMARAAGEIADGFHVHPLHSPGYLRDVVRPAIAAGARAAGRDPAMVELIAPVFIVTGESARERAAAERDARRQIAFYASTPTYRPFLAYHGLRRSGRAQRARARGPLRRDGRAGPGRAARGGRRERRARRDRRGAGGPLRDGLVQRIYPYAASRRPTRGAPRGPGRGDQTRVDVEPVAARRDPPGGCRWPAGPAI